jgi:prepilin-type N-terminal cleavage/methylation domain-containing protein
MKRQDESGFTLIETLIALSMLAIVSTAFYMLLFSVIQGSNSSRSVARQSEEARLGFNRMVRDTREAGLILPCSPSAFATCYRVQIDFDNNGAITNPNANGDYEDMTYAYAPAARAITLNGETLIDGVRAVTGKNVFQYESNALQYDANADGVTTAAELDSSGVAGVGNGNGQLDNPELSYITSINYTFRVGTSTTCSTTPGHSGCETFFASAQLRNRR